MKKARTRVDRTLRIRKARLDASIARVKRKITSLEKKLRQQSRILSKRKARRTKLK